MFDLDNKYPIIFFPIRIESRYATTEIQEKKEDGTIVFLHNRALRLRFFPDVITINNFDHRLTKKEVEDARDYWKTTGTSDRNSVWTNLANKYGLPRAAYIVKAVINNITNSEPDPINPSMKSDDKIEMRDEENYLSPTCKLLPSRFVVYAKFKDPALGNLEPFPVGKEIPESLSLDPAEIEESLPSGETVTNVRKILSGIQFPKNKNELIDYAEQHKDTILDPEPLIEILKKLPDPDFGDMSDVEEALGKVPSKSPNWVTDFDEAVQKGMAIEIKLSEGQYRKGFEYIIVFGVREGVSPESAKQAIEDLFRAHRYSGGMSFVKQGTPTNLTKGKSKDKHSFFSPHSFTQSDINAYRSEEFAALKEEHPGLIATYAPDGRIFERALGLDNVASGLENAGNDDQMTAICMSYALWPSILNYPIKRFFKTTSGGVINTPILYLNFLQNHFVKYVSAQGFIPPIRLGKTPYGILPVTILSEWRESKLLVDTNSIKGFFRDLITRWTKFVDLVPTVMNRAGGTLQTETLLNILSMEPISHTYYVRGFRSLEYITDFISEILNVKNISNADLKIKNKLLLNILLKITFPFFPRDALDNFYDFCPGNDIAEIKIPMVNMPDDAETVEPNYIKDMLEDIKGSDRNFLRSTKAQKEIEGVGPSDTDPLLLRLLRYSASKIGEINDQNEVDKLTECLEILRDKSPDRLKALMLQTLDLVSYRLDAWISSFANQRLDQLRQNTAKGLHAGAFGWIENLMPEGFVTGVNPISEGGYIHASSYTHAATAAVLRNGYLTHVNESDTVNEYDKKDLLKINLNSLRTKNALEIINGIGNTPLSELLGYRLERRLHDAELDYLIDEFRKYFPLNKPNRKGPEVTVPGGQEAIELRNLTDGLAVFKNWKRLTEGSPSFDANTIKSLMENDEIAWKQFYSEIKKYAPQDAQMVDIINSLKPQLNYLLDQMDGLSDLCLAEAVYQAVGGNYLRSGAVLDGMSGDGQIPIPEISLIPRSGPRQVQRVALAVEVEPMATLTLQDPNDDIPWTSPRKLAEPNCNKLINTYIGDITFWLDLKDTSGNVVSTEELGLSELGLEAIDLLYIENSEIEARINHYGQVKGITNFEIRYEQAESSAEHLEKKSYRDLQFLMKSMRGLMAQGQPLKYSDFVSVNERVSKELIMDSIKEIFKRYYDISHLVHQTIRQLNLAKDDDTDVNAEKKRRALMKAGFFLKEYAVPLDSKGNISVSVEELDNKIVQAIEQLKSRLPQGGDQVAKLSAWRSALKDKGQEVFLESIVNEVAGEPQNTDKYLQTLDILIERIKTILNIDSFLILPPVSIQKTSDKLKSSAQLNKKILKWIGKASYVRPRMRLLDDIFTYSQILELSNFSFYCDETKFMKSASILTSNNEEINPVSLILAVSTKTGEQEKTDIPKSLVGVVADEWTDKFVAKEQDTCIAFHYDGPNTEAPQSLLLAVAPNDEYKWNENSIVKVLLETLELMKLRVVDYSSLKELRLFLPTLLFNSHGEDTHINLYQKGVTE